MVIATSHLADSLPSLWVAGTCEEASLAVFRLGWSQFQGQPKSAAFFTYFYSMPCGLHPCILVHAVLYYYQIPLKGVAHIFFCYHHYKWHSFCIFITFPFLSFLFLFVFQSGYYLTPRLQVCLVDNLDSTVQFVPMLYSDQ